MLIKRLRSGMRFPLALLKKGGIRILLRKICPRWRGLWQWFSILVLAITLVSACNNTVVDHSKTQTPCRVVQHAMGETCVPNNPQRLIALSRFTLANALVLGVKPVGSTSDYKFPPYLKDQIVGIDEVGGMYEPNLEKILLLKPDLILGLEFVRSSYPLLSQIRPAVLGKWDGGTSSWQEHFDFVAEVLGKQDTAKKAWERYYQKIEQLKTDLNNRYQNAEISVLEIGGDGGIYIDETDSFASSILNDAGLQRLKTQVGMLPSKLISEEKLKEIDSDIIFAFISNYSFSESRQAFEALQQKPLWKKLKAVQNGQVYAVDREVWIGSNFFAADLVIDDLYKYLVNTP